MRPYFLFILLFFSFSITSIGLTATQDSYPAPSQLPHVRPQMLSAGYWISRHPSVDKIVMTSEGINAFNDNIRNNLKLTKDIFTLVEHFQTENLMDVFKGDLKEFSDKNYYTLDGLKADESLLDKIKNDMHLSGVIIGMEPRYGLVVHFANQRLLPTKQGLFEQKGDVDFDQLQNSGLDVGTSVAVVHQSRDGKWYYVFSAISDGWLEAENMAIGNRNTVKNFSQAKDFIVVTAAHGEIFLDPQMTQFDEYARMGVKFPLLQENETQWVVQLPLKDKFNQLQFGKGYIPKTQAHRGYLPYSARTIYAQSFAMLDKPYGWGDINGRQDCSRFIQMVYATVGLELPRDSKEQAKVGEELASFDNKTVNQEKLEKLKSSLGALTILPMKGHIMLYLGMADGVPFAIHATSGYSKTQGEIQTKYVLNRVVVSDLYLGENSAKGSLLRRLSKIVGIR